MSNGTTAPAAAIEAVARASGLTVTAVENGTDFAGVATTRATVALPANTSKHMLLELSESFEAADPAFLSAFQTFFAEAAVRLRNPRPDCYLTLQGLPLSFGKFAWPFHKSTSGADTFVVHGEIRLEDGHSSVLHAKVAAALTQTFAEALPSIEQPFAESFMYNAVRKTLDQGQLELVKSGNRQPVPVTTRYYSAKQQRFIFNDTSAAQRTEFLAAKTYWLSHVLGSGEPVWLADPRDAQYLNTTVDELAKTAAALAGDGLITLAGEWAQTTTRLAGMRESYEQELADALAFIRPTFNEDMRAGNTNM